MINQLLPAGAAGGTLVIAWYLWKAQVIAAWVRIASLILVLAAAGTVAGVVDLARLVELVRVVPVERLVELALTLGGAPVVGGT